MFRVKFEKYWCDYIRTTEVKSFNTVDDIFNWLKTVYSDGHNEEWRKRYCIHGFTKSYAPNMELSCVLPSKSGYMGSVWVQEINYNGITIFEKGKYISPKMQEYLNTHDFGKMISKEYGDF